MVALVIAGPKQPMTERAKFVIDQFLMKGKSVAFFVDGMTFETPQQMQMPGQAAPPQIGRKNDTGLDDLLAPLRLQDRRRRHPRAAEERARARCRSTGRCSSRNYPTFLATDSIAKSSPLFEHIDALILPFASSVELLKDNKAQAGLVYTQLAQSSDRSWRQKGFFLFNPTVPLKPGDEHGPFALGYTAEGKFKSFFAGKPLPQREGREDHAAAPNASLPPGRGEADRRGADAGAPRRRRHSNVRQRHVPRRRRRATCRPIRSTCAFALNVIDWLAQDKALSSIRAKAITPRPITYRSESTPTVLQAVNIVGVPLLVHPVRRGPLAASARRGARAPSCNASV